MSRRILHARVVLSIGCAAGAFVSLSVTRGAAAARPRRSPGRASMVECGEAYAKADTSSALGILGDVIRRGGRTSWEQEALYLRAWMRLKELDDRGSALQDLRLLTTRHPGTAAAAFGQFQIARLYEQEGRHAEAYREYVLCSRLRGLHARETTEFPAQRITTAGGLELVELASLRAARLFARAARRRDPDVPLPRGSFLLSDPPEPIEIPADISARSAPHDMATPWYILAPPGTSIASVSVDFSAYVDMTSAGPKHEKRYSFVLEPCVQRTGYERPRVLALAGVSRKPQHLVRETALAPPAEAVRLSLYRHGARVTRCVIRASLGAAPAKREDTPPELPGFATSVPPAPGGAGSPCIASTGIGVLLVYHTPGPTAESELLEDRDIHLTLTRDGKEWASPRRLRISSAVDDCDPTIAALPDGRLLMAWTSNRRGMGSSDLYVSESRDALEWTSPAMLPVRAQDLESFSRDASVTCHGPALWVDARGGINLFFIAKGLEDRGREAPSLEAAGLYRLASEHGRRWSAPAVVISTPQTPLDRIKPAPKVTLGREYASWAHRPSVCEPSPGRLVVAWITTHGRLLLSRHTSPGDWSTENSALAGADINTAASAAVLLGSLPGGSLLMLLTRRDLGPRLVWRTTTLVRAQPLTDEPSGIDLGMPAAARNPWGAGWLSAWVATKAPGPTGVYVREVTAPEVQQ